MSAPPRNLRGGGPLRGRAATSTVGRSRRNPRARGGRGRSGSDAVAFVATPASARPETTSSGPGLQSRSSNQELAASQRGSGQPPVPGQRSNRGRNGRANLSQPQSSRLAPSPSHRDYMNDMTAKFQELKTEREVERVKAIKDGFLADPEKKTSLDKAITPLGTCTEMCPEFERLERIVQNMVDKAEKVFDDQTGREVPSQERMVKRFRRSAAGYDEQLPSDIRTPAALQMTLNYLLDEVMVGAERLAEVHKFVWDRTRGIRNDFSIQQVTSQGDVQIAVDCFERIARFHILSLHQLSNPDNLTDEHFDAYQEREQLNNTLLSLMYYYDDHRRRQKFENEAEFRAYCIILELQSQQPDLEDRMQAWPQELLGHARIRVAFKLYSAAGNTLYEQGPLKPQAAFDIAQGNAAGFWNILRSKEVNYLTSCVAEIYFNQVRFMALQELWKSTKRAPPSVQAKIQDWTLGELTKLLGFDDERQASEFCYDYNIGFKTNDTGEQFLDFTSRPENTLDRSSTPNKQVFSFAIVEEKRYHRTLSAVINGIPVAQAIREGQVTEQGDDEYIVARTGLDPVEDDSMFVPETESEEQKVLLSHPSATFSPLVTSFIPAPSATQSTAPSTSLLDHTFIKGLGDSGNVFPSAAPSTLLQFPKSTVSATRTSSDDRSGPNRSLRNEFLTLPRTESTALSGPSSFGRPSLLVNGPSSSVVSTAPPVLDRGWPPARTDGAVSFGNNSWPPAIVNGVANTDKTYENPQLASMPEHDIEPNNRLLQGPLVDNDTAGSIEMAHIQSIDKPPSSPRPGYKHLSSTADHTSAASPFSVAPQLNVHAHSAPRTGSDGPPAAPIVNDHGRNGPEEASQVLSPNSAPSKSRPARTEQSENSQGSGEIRHNNTISSSLNPQASPAPQPDRRGTVSVPPISTTKSAIPPSFAPNTTPSFTSPASTIPKNKSPLGSQPPILAAETSAKQPPSRPRPADLSKAAHNLAAVGLLEPQGILLQYLEHTAASLVEDALLQFEHEKPVRAAHSAHYDLLSKKYFRRWKSILWRRKLNRNASSRRQQLAQSIRREGERKARGDAELEAILEAQRQKERVQAEQLRRSLEDPNPQVPVTRSRDGQPTATTAGRKRKSLHGDENDTLVNGNSSRKAVKSHSHRRSKTMTPTSETSKAGSVDRTSPFGALPRLSSSVFSGRSIMLDHTTTSDLRRFRSGRKIDSTRTDHFRLKALGLDPDTPLFPETQSSLERKRRRQEELSRLTPRNRASTFSSATSSTSELQVPRNIRAPENAFTTAEEIPSANAPQVLENDDDFLSQVREVREAMSEDTAWFKQQAQQIEKEVAQEEELRAHRHDARLGPRGAGPKVGKVGEATPSGPVETTGLERTKQGTGASIKAWSPLQVLKRRSAPMKMRGPSRECLT